MTVINLQSSKREEIAEALQLKRSIENFEFVFLLDIFSKLLGAIDLTLNYLEYDKADLCLAIDHLETRGLLKRINSYRESFIEAKVESIYFAQKWGSKVKFQDKRGNNNKRHFEELADDHRLNIPEDRFRINIFNCVLDIVNA